MRLWFAHGSEVTIREQLVTQVILAILSGDLSPGERLPSTRDLARRFGLHPNTVSAGYRRLEHERWVEFRHGSGVYVRQQRPEQTLPAVLALDQMIGGLFRSARALGLPLPEIRARLQHWIERQPPNRFLLLEPDEELRRIVVAEMRLVVSLPVDGCALSARIDPSLLARSIPAALPSKVAKARAALTPGIELLELRVRSVPASLAAYLPAPSDALIGVASRWPDFVRLARTMLLASGFAPESLLFRDAREPRWQRGLEQTAGVVCDVVTSAALPAKTRAVRYTLLDESSIAELRQYEAFLSRSLPAAP